MNNIKLSIIIPVYNAERHLRQCIDSVLRQSFRNLELILVDDGSEDSSLSICNHYIGNSDIPVRVIHQNNSGSSLARKNGMLAAQGDYIGFVDADDYVECDMYENMIANAENHDADIVMCGISYLRGDNLIPAHSKIDAGVYMSDKLEQLKRNRCMDGSQDANEVIPPSLCNKIMKRELVSKHMRDINERLSMGDDWVVSYPCLWDAKTMVIMRECYYIYRYNSAGITKSYNKYMWQDASRLFNVAMQIKNKYNYQNDIYYHYYFQYITLLCLVNETRSNCKHNWLHFRNRIKNELSGAMEKYAFNGLTIKCNSKISKIIIFCVRHRAYGLLALFLICYN